MTKKVMLIDDSEIEIFISTKLLSISKVTTKISSYLEASEAVTHIYNHRHSPEHLPDYILLDSHMP
ncbi:MAG: hypothetical protein HYZ42_18375 [Bacteroidetes bacterium]|nr:hypothetical protein [Bacteroidota bacterium]